MEFSADEIVNNQQASQFEIVLHQEKAYLTYRINTGIIALMHTFVPGPIEGLGIASALAKAAFEYAASHHLLVKIYCSFVAGWIHQHPEYKLLLDPESTH